jgi:1-acyl-sn-glycerol-3-phosphate acyltransferase
MFIAALSRPVLRLLWRYQARGIENLPRGGFVLAAGHHSNFDPWPLGIALSKTRFVRFMAKSELFWWPLGPIIQAIGGFKTRRSKGLRKRRQVEVHDGAARIALGAGVPLVPAALAGTDRLARFVQLRVLYGKPIPVDDLAGLPRRQAARIATERLMARIHELEAELGAG